MGPLLPNSHSTRVQYLFPKYKRKYNLIIIISHLILSNNGSLALFFDTKIVAVLFFIDVAVVVIPPVAGCSVCTSSVVVAVWTEDCLEARFAAASMRKIVSLFNSSCFFSSNIWASSRQCCGGRSPDLTLSSTFHISSSSNELPRANISSVSSFRFDVRSADGVMAEEHCARETNK